MKSVVEQRLVVTLFSRLLFRMKLFFICVSIWLGLLVGVVYAGDMSGYAWSSNIGWISFDGTNYGVGVDDNTGALSGYAWSPNIGWIAMSGVIIDDSDILNGRARACAGASDSITCRGGIAPNTGEWDGWVSFSGPHYEVKRVVSETGCTLEGWAWGSDVIGWVRFGGTGYDVFTEPCSVEPPPDPVGDITCVFNVVPPSLIFPRNQVTLVWTCENAESCILSGIGPVSNVSGSLLMTLNTTTSYALDCSNDAGGSYHGEVEARLYRPVYCDVIPHGPGCQ